MSCEGSIARRTCVLLHVFTGGKNGYQVEPFSNALAMVRTLSGLKNVHLICEFQNNDQVRKLHWTPNNLVDWLIEADIHFILTHVHQGMLHWNTADVIVALSRLSGHQGFPSGLELTCPIFLQDKWAYI